MRLTHLFQNCLDARWHVKRVCLSRSWNFQNEIGKRNLFLGLLWNRCVCLKVGISKTKLENEIYFWACSEAYVLPMWYSVLILLGRYIYFSKSINDIYVYIFIYLSIYRSIYLSIDLSIYLSIYGWNDRSIDRPIALSIDR